MANPTFKWPGNPGTYGEFPGTTVYPPAGPTYTKGQATGTVPAQGGESNPYYQSVLASLQAAGASDAAQRRQNIQQALIAFGMDPSQAGFKDPYGDVDQGTRDLIKKNTDSGISMYARLLDAKDQDRKALLNRIGAKGLFRSGAKGYGLRRKQLEYDRGLADQLATLAQNLGNFTNSFASNEAARQQSLASALANAYQSYVPPQSWSGFSNSPTYANYAGSGGAIAKDLGARVGR